MIYLKALAMTVLSLVGVVLYIATIICLAPIMWLFLYVVLMHPKSLVQRKDTEDT